MAAKKPSIAFAEAIRRGSKKLHPEILDSQIHHVNCTAGDVFKMAAVGARIKPGWFSVRRAWPWLRKPMRSPCRCSSRKFEQTSGRVSVSDVLKHLWIEHCMSDDSRWKIEAIVEWVEVVDPSGDAARLRRKAQERRLKRARRFTPADRVRARGLGVLLL
jgi:hypothetical protein